MNPNRLKRLFPNASSTFIKQNSDPEIESTGKDTKLEHSSKPAPLRETRPQEKDSGRYVICITSFRKRQCDEDNLCEKFHVDTLRYSGAIPVDSPDQTSIITCQKKIGKGQEEYTLIEVYYEPNR